MEKSKYNYLEILYLMYYLIYPFCLCYLLSDSGTFYLHSFWDFVFQFLPSVVSWCLTLSYIVQTNKVSERSLQILTVSILFHLIIIFFLFYFFTKEEESASYRTQKIISFFGIALSVLVWITSLLKFNKLISRR